MSGNNSVPNTVVARGYAWRAADSAILRTTVVTAYTAHQAVGSSVSCLFTWSTFFPLAYQTSLLTGMRLTVSSSVAIAIPTGVNVRAHIYNTSPTSPPSSDYALYTGLIANEPYKLGYVDFNTFAQGSTLSNYYSAYGTPVVTPMPLQSADAGKGLYAFLESPSGGWTPNAASSWQLYVSRQD